jgi:hypothetical protein
MITIVIAGYAVVMLTIVLALAVAAGRPQPKPSDVVLEAPDALRSAPPVFRPTIPTSNRGGTEVLAFEA